MTRFGRDRRLLAVSFCTAFLMSAAIPALGGLEFEAIHRATPEGGAVQQVLPSDVAEGRRHLATGLQEMVWVGGSFISDFGNFNYVRRAGLDGENVQDLFGPGAFAGVVIDTQNAKLYMSPTSDCAPGCTAIARSNLDGSNAEWLFPAGFPGAIAVYAPTGLVCWSDSAFGDDFESSIACGTVGENEGHVVVSETATGLAIDPLQLKLYWTRSDRVRRSNLDGTDIEDLVVGLDDARDLALDPAGNRMWWTERDLGKIQSAELDGSNVTDVVTGLDSPTGIDFFDAPGGPADDRIYWLSVAPAPGVPASSVPGVVFLAVALLMASSWHRRASKDRRSSS